MKENGEDVQIVCYTNNDDFKKKVTALLKELKGEEVSLTDITILSQKRYENSMIGKAGIPVNILGKDELYENRAVFSTIQGYKGLDSRVVILTDMDDMEPARYQQYVYIAATRARTLLYVIRRGTIQPDEQKRSKK